jgi:hypothetical protein
MDTENCENCKFWEEIDPDDVPSGYCQRFPPQVLGRGEDGQLDIVFPWTNDKDWCGEFRRK